MTKTSQVAPQKLRRLAFQSRDLAEYVHMLSLLHAPVKAKRFDAKPFSIEVDAVQTGGIYISRADCATGVDLKFSSTFDGYWLSLVNCGGFEASTAGLGDLQAIPGNGLMVDSSLTTRAASRADTQLLRISVTSEELHGRLVELIDEPVLRRIRFAPHVSSETAVGATSRTLADLLAQGAAGKAPLLPYPAAVESIRAAILNLLLEGVPHNYTERVLRTVPCPAPRHFRRAIEFMSANASRPVRLAEIANAAGTSARSLQTGFMRFRGTTPLEHLRGIRLSGARGELLSGDPEMTVTHAAYAWGFPHLPSFSSRYTRAFGEAPSVTLRRAKQKA